MKDINIVLALLMICSVAMPLVGASTSDVQMNYGIWFFNLPPVRGEVKVWVQNTPVTNLVTEAIQYAQGAVTQWNQEYPAYTVNITYTIHVQEPSELGPPRPSLDLPGAMSFVRSSSYNVFILTSSLNSTCATGAAYMNPPIIEMTYSNMPRCQEIDYSATIHELGHQVLRIGDLYNGPGPGTWLQTHPLINGEIMQGTPSFQSYSTLDFYGSWMQEQLYKQYGASMPAGANNPIYLPNSIPFKWYCSSRQLDPNNPTGSVGCPLPPILMWAMCPNPRENCLTTTTTTTTTSETVASSTLNINDTTPTISISRTPYGLMLEGSGFTPNSTARCYVNGTASFDTGTTPTGHVLMGWTSDSFPNGTATIWLVDTSTMQQSNSVAATKDGPIPVPEFPGTPILLLILLTAGALFLRRQRRIKP